MLKVGLASEALQRDGLLGEVSRAALRSRVKSSSPFEGIALFWADSMVRSASKDGLAFDG